MDLPCCSSPRQYRRQVTEPKFKNDWTAGYLQKKGFSLQHWTGEAATAFALLFQWLIVIPISKCVPLLPVAPVASSSARAEFSSLHYVICAVLHFRRKEPKTHNHRRNNKDEEEVL